MAPDDLSGRQYQPHPSAAGRSLARTRGMLASLGSPHAVLRAARESAGLSLADVAQQMAVRPAYLEAVEKGDMSVLPGSGYAGGLIGLYAQWLGLDADSLLEAAFPPTGRGSPPPGPVGGGGLLQPSADARPAPGRFAIGKRLVARRPGVARAEQPAVASPTPSARAQVVAREGSTALLSPEPPVSTEAFSAAPADAISAPADAASPAPADPAPPPPTTQARRPVPPVRHEETIASDGTTFALLRWALLVLLVLLVLAAAALIVVVLIRSFEPQTPLEGLLSLLRAVA